MRYTRLVIIAVIAAAVMIPVGWVIVLTFSLSGLCGEKIAARYLSPEGGRTALVIVRDCGATTDFNTSVAIRASGESHPLGNDYVFSVKGLNNIEVVWEEVWNPNRHHYTIVYDRPNRIFRQILVWQGEKISYRER